MATKRQNDSPSHSSSQMIDIQVGNLSARHMDILALARRASRVHVDELAKHFAVTPQTIRKDLNELCENNYLHRIHGGAIAPAGVSNVDYKIRRFYGAEAKYKIAQEAASMVPDNASIFLNIGSTTEQVALALRSHKNLLVITNNINVVNILLDAPQIDVIVASGLVRHNDGGIVGENTADFIRQFRLDYAIIGASAIDNDGEIFDFDMREVKISKAILESARTSILVADSSKFKRSAPVRIAHLEDIHYFITEETPPQSVLDNATKSGLKIVTV